MAMFNHKDISDEVRELFKEELNNHLSTRLKEIEVGEHVDYGFDYGHVRPLETTMEGANDNLAEVAYRNKQLLAQKNKLYNLFWKTTLRCNAKCKHCGSRAGEHVNIDQELTTQEIKDTFNSIAKRYCADEILINVTGGEPLLRKDLFEVMTYAKKLGFHWGMTTNGIQINDEIIEKMKLSGMETISISVDGLRDTHNEFRGVHNSYERIYENC